MNARAISMRIFLMPKRAIRDTGSLSAGSSLMTVVTAQQAPAPNPTRITRSCSLLTATRLLSSVARYTLATAIARKVTPARRLLPLLAYELRGREERHGVVREFLQRVTVCSPHEFEWPAAQANASRTGR